MQKILAPLGLEPSNRGATTGGSQGWLTIRGAMLTGLSPIDGQPIAHIEQATAEDYDAVVATGSDCGIANVNIGTSGAEIGGRFRRGKGDRRPRIRFRCLAGLHAATNQQHQRGNLAAAGPGDGI